MIVLDIVDFGKYSDQNKNLYDLKILVLMFTLVDWC
jgi:hypothetical protein